MTLSSLVDEFTLPKQVIDFFRAQGSFIYPKFVEIVLRLGGRLIEDDLARRHAEFGKRTLAKNDSVQIEGCGLFVQGQGKHVPLVIDGLHGRGFGEGGGLIDSIHGSHFQSV